MRPFLSLGITALAAGMGLATIQFADAQPMPFDMSGERPAEEPPAERPARPQQPAPTPTDGRAEPEAPPAVAQPEPAAPVQAADIRRRLLPAGSITLAGESAVRSWSFYLTDAQAVSPTRLQVGFRNAVVVAPESSRLEVLLNQTPVSADAIGSADGFAQHVVDVPEGLLRTGRNEITIRARQRHRTDCTVESTYELWTEIDAARTWLSFADNAAAIYTGIGDLRAIAADTQGRTRVEIVAPAISVGDIGGDILRLAQAIALHASMPNMDFSIVAAPSETGDGLALRVFLGGVDELATLAELPPAAANGPVAAFLGNAGDDVPTFLVSGRNRAEWLSAIERVLEPVDRPQGGMRETLHTSLWQSPDAPMIYGDRTLSLAELGVTSGQFSGRRIVTDFQFAIPGDFFAGSYGEASLLIDAAYSSAVRPGSRINIYVNGSIASSVPLSARNGAILNQLPVNLTMRHFRPGLNDVAVEAVLETDQDAACLPGATAEETPRFALFDTSAFIMPQFGRIGQRPNLDAFSGVAYPYGLAQEPVAVVIDRSGGQTLSAAANLFARMAQTAGRAIPLDLATSPDAVRARDALFLGPINGIPAGVLAQVSVDEASRTGWTATSNVGRPAGDDRVNVDTWRQEMDQQGLHSYVETIRKWFRETFGITMDMIRFAPVADAGFVPPQSAVLLVAQGENPAGNGVWTLVSAPDATRLAQGAGALARQGTWQQLSGHLATLDGTYTDVVSQPTTAFSFVETQPASFGNYRLIVANWLSANILSYSLLLVIACVALGIMTSALLSRLGRRR